MNEEQYCKRLDGFTREQLIEECCQQRRSKVNLAEYIDHRLGAVVTVGA